MTAIYDVKQFRPTMFIVVAIGFLGYALAFGATPVWFLCVAAMAFNAQQVRSGRYRPIPRWLASVVTLAALYFSLHGFQAFDRSIDAVALFLMLLQVVKLYEIRGNRDFAQLLVLSLLLMVAAAIGTALLAFGILLIIYLFISLYCCLLFHLKVEAEAARDMLSLPENRINPAALRHDQRHLARSMRRLTGIFATVSITSAVLVFLFCPRPSGEGLFAGLQQRPLDPITTGFSDRVTLGGTGRITQNPAEVAYVQVWKHDRLVRGTETLYLRGGVYYDYQRDAREANRWGWQRREDGRLNRIQASAGQSISVRRETEGVEPAEKWRQRITLLPTGESPLFALAGVYAVQVDQDLNLNFSARDGLLRSESGLDQRIEYEVLSDNRLPIRFRRWWPMPDETPHSRMFDAVQSEFDPAVAALAKDERVSGSDANGPLAAQRPPGAPTELDAKIAANIESYLQRTYSYTLDLSNEDPMEGKDPVVRFLQDHKKGHCVYFASAMTLMCQSLGMRARYVSGFRCDGDSYYPIGDYYIVQQLHAHAWVEVLTPDGWKRFDPTSAREAPSTTPSLWRRARHAFNYLQYKWQASVIAYDADDRDNLVSRLNTGMTNAAISSSTAWGDFRRWLGGSEMWNISYKLLAALVAFMLLGILAAIGWFLWERWKLRQKARAIGLQSLSPAEQLRLARQLGFYADLLMLLEHRNLRKPHHQTPLEFAKSLSFLPQSAHNAIIRLTRIFYRVRFGGAVVRPHHHRRLQTALTAIATTLPPQQQN